MSQTPQLKLQGGWFAAGAPLLQAMEAVSDGAFKLFVYLCLKADRSTGELSVSPTQLARALRKSRRSLFTYLGNSSREVCFGSASPTINTSALTSRFARPSGPTKDPLSRSPKRPNPNTSIRWPVCCSMPLAFSAPSPRPIGSWPLASTARACPCGRSGRPCCSAAPASTSPGSTATPEAPSPP